MIGTVHIDNFKSLRGVKFDARRVNLFVGEPNTGKSNILEALALFSYYRFDPATFKEVLRFEAVADLFFDQRVDATIRLTVDKLRCRMEFMRGGFKITYGDEREDTSSVDLDASGRFSNWARVPDLFRYYRFKPGEDSSRQEYGVLAPPFGVNLAAILYTNKDLRRRVSDLFRTRGFRLEIKPVDMKLALAKYVDDDLYSFPYESISETWRRIAFYMAVLETNKSAVLLLDEPEANTFPYYTKYLAEHIAEDSTNQFFVTTHNPYMLLTLVKKTPPEELAVFVTRMEKFETKIKQIPDSRMAELQELGSDAFFNLDGLAGE